MDVIGCMTKVAMVTYYTVFRFLWYCMYLLPPLPTLLCVKSKEIWLLSNIQQVTLRHVCDDISQAFLSSGSDQMLETGQKSVNEADKGRSTLKELLLHGQILAHFECISNLFTIPNSNYLTGFQFHVTINIKLYQLLTYSVCWPPKWILRTVQ